MMHPLIARSIGNPIAVPHDSEGLAILGGVGALMGTALLSYVVSPPLSPRPGLAALTMALVAAGTGWGAFKTNQSHPRFSTALGITAILAAFGAAANLWIASMYGATGSAVTAPATPPATTS